MANCIMGVSFGMGIDDLRVFISSARRVWDDDILILGDKLSTDTLTFLSENHVRFIDGHEKPARFFMGRWQFYIPHLKEYKHVLISDIRDVAFQLGPLLTHGLHVTEEDAPIEREPYNTAWVKVWGDDTYERIKGFPILCAGTVWGDSNSIMELCRTIDGRGMDQGTLNAVVRDGILTAEVHANGEMVWTLGLYGYDWANEVMPLVDFHIDGDVVYAPDGSVPAIIHQYDRHPKLVEHFKRLYV